MSKPLIASFLSVLLVLPIAAASVSAQEPTEGQKVEQTMAKFTDDLQALEAEAVAKAVTLNATEAAAFWPQFKAYQAEQRKIGEGQIAAVRDYADQYMTLSDEQALAYVNALLVRDREIHDLRVKYLAIYTKTIGEKRAARVIHLARKLGFQSQARLSEVIPLVR